VRSSSTAAVPAVAQRASVIRLSSNENPYGPPPAAFEAMRDAFGASWRYPDEREDELVEQLAALHGVTRDGIVLGNGSSQILDLAAAAYLGPTTGLALAEPTFEAIRLYAERRRAAIVKVPLTADWRHDVEAMAAAAQGAGVLYICNPNNPTGTLTPAAELRALLDAVPPSVVVLVDEAYHHYAEGAAGYESVASLLADHPNLLVARTFSKIYGMAGLRCGYAIGRPERIRELRAQRPWDSLNLMALAAAGAALGDHAHLERSRRLNAEQRAWTAGEIERLGYRVLPSAANFLMFDLRRDVAPVIAALAAAGVEVGRRFAAVPTHLRVTIGREEDMRAFIAALPRAAAAAAA
jgi:histidinol-phosphate aminotransferase